MLLYEKQGSIGRPRRVLRNQGWFEDVLIIWKFVIVWSHHIQKIDTLVLFVDDMNDASILTNYLFKGKRSMHQRKYFFFVWNVFSKQIILNKGQTSSEQSNTSTCYLYLSLYREHQRTQTKTLSPIAGFSFQVKSTQLGFGTEAVLFVIAQSSRWFGQ